MHNDEPALLDALDRRALIEEVGEAIATCAPPQVFGIHGDWGLGKTSFLHQVQWYLTGDCPQQPETAIDKMKNAERVDSDPSTRRTGVYRRNVQAVWFDAWRYQNEDAPVVALLHEMRAQLSWGTRVIRSTARRTRAAARGALLSMEELTKKIGFQYSKFQQANRELEADNLAATLPSHTLREHLRAAVAQLLPKTTGGKTPRLVVFVDDVDRCDAEAAYRLLEGLKIYLTLDNCVFVLGMNQKVIVDALRQRSKTTDENESSMRAAAYMEKLCQNVWQLPAVRQPVQLLRSLLVETVQNPTVRTSIDEVFEALPHPCLPPNPRRLKGLANLIGRLSSRLPDTQTTDEMMFETRLLLVVAYVYQFHHDLYVRWESNPSLYSMIRDWCQGRAKPHPAFAQLELPLKPPEADLATDFASNFPDPTEAKVFWIQSLVVQLSTEVSPSNFARYLHGVAT